MTSTNARNLQEWNNDVCGCFDDTDSCIVGFFLPCWTYADNASLLDTASGKKNGSSFTENFVGYCLASYCCLCGVLGCQLRGDIRKQYGLKGDDCNGFLLHCCLSRCALCQENRELKQRNVASSVGTPVDEAPAQVQMGTN